MPSNPTTKSQVHAYKFVLRRMQSALVRRDAVMLHDPMRTHSRATMVGVVLSALGVLGFIIFGLFKPAPEPPGSGTIVIGESSGQVYVSVGEPQELIPTFNLASARLLLAAQQNRSEDGGNKSGLAVGSAPEEPAEPEVIPDEQLVDIPRGKPTGIPFGPSLLPSEEQRISPHWAVCENIDLDQDLPKQEARSRAEPNTTVVAGTSELGHELQDDEALLVRSPDDVTYLVYRLEENPNDRNADVVRAKVDLNDPAVTQAYGLSSAQPRKVSTAMLDAIPEEQEITAPDIAQQSNDKWGLGVGVGGTFHVKEANGDQYYVLTKGGKKKISEPVATLIQNEYQETKKTPLKPPKKAASVPVVESGGKGDLDVETFPSTKPTVLTPFSTPSACLGWRITGQGEDPEGHTTLYVNQTSPVPTNEKGESKAVEISEASPDGYQVDEFYMPKGRAAVVRSATSPKQYETGPIQLVSGLGVRYGVPNGPTAQVLGLGSQDPAPERILRLLPVGKSLNMQNAQQTWPSSALNNVGDGAAAAATDN